MPRTDSDPPIPSRASWIEGELKRKANKEWVESELGARDTSIGQAKSIASEAKRKAEKHPCNHEEEISNMKASLNSLKNWKTGGFIGVIVLIVSVVVNYASLSGTVKATKEDVVEVRQAQKEMNAEVTGKIDSLESKIVQTDKAQVSRDIQQQRDLKNTVKEAVHEALVDSRSKRK